MLILCLHLTHTHAHTEFTLCQVQLETRQNDRLNFPVETSIVQKRTEQRDNSSAEDGMSGCDMGVQDLLKRRCPSWDQGDMCWNPGTRDSKESICHRTELDVVDEEGGGQSWAQWMVKKRLKLSRWGGEGSDHYKDLEITSRIFSSVLGSHLEFLKRGVMPVNFSFENVALAAWGNGC